MDDAIAGLGSFMTANRSLAAPLFGLLAFGESLVGVGIVIPATPILFLMGTLLGSGTLDIVPVIGWAVGGAIAGYWLSWMLGRRLGYRIYFGRALRGHRRGVARARLFFRRWGGPALIFGRYLLGPFQSALPLVAGVARMDARRFHAWNAASGVIWVTACLTPGYLASQGLLATHLDVLQAALTIVSVALILLGVIAIGWRMART